MASSVQAQGPADQARAQPGRAGGRRVALAGYRWLLLAFLLGCAAQIFLAGLGVFSFGDRDAAGGASAFNAHMTLGFALGGVAVIVLILALIARPGVLAMSLAGVLWSSRPACCRACWTAWVTTPPRSAACTPRTGC